MEPKSFLSKFWRVGLNCLLFLFLLTGLTLLGKALIAFPWKTYQWVHLDLTMITGYFYVKTWIRFLTRRYLWSKKTVEQEINEEIEATTKTSLSPPTRPETPTAKKESIGEDPCGPV